LAPGSCSSAVSRKTTARVTPKTWRDTGLDKASRSQESYRQQVSGGSAHRHRVYPPGQGESPTRGYGLIRPSCPRDQRSLQSELRRERQGAELLQFCPSGTRRDRDRLCLCQSRALEISEARGPRPVGTAAALTNIGTIELSLGNREVASPASPGLWPPTSRRQGLTWNSAGPRHDRGGVHFLAGELGLVVSHDERALEIYGAPPPALPTWPGS
jgi:hypothetical protein